MSGLRRVGVWLRLAAGSFRVAAVRLGLVWLRFAAGLWPGGLASIFLSVRMRLNFLSKKKKDQRDGRSFVFPAVTVADVFTAGGCGGIQVIENRGNRVLENLSP